MIIDNGQHIKCVLRNNTVIEGIVEEWSHNCVQLRSLGDQSLLIIPHPEQDIMMIKILTQATPEKEITKSPNLSYCSSELEQKIQETYDLPSDNPDRIKTLAELKVMLAEQEKQIIKEKLKNHHIGEVRKVQYGYPGFIKKPSTE